MVKVHVPHALGCLALLLACSATQFSAAVDRVEVRVSLRERNTLKLEQFFHEVSDPRHPNYARYLTLSTMRDMIGVTAEDWGSAKSWLAANNATAITLSPARTHASCAMPAGRAIELEAAAYGHGGPTVVQFLWLAPFAAVQRQNSSVSALSRTQFLRKAMKGVRLGDSDPNSLKQAMGMPTSVLAKAANNTQMAWGPGTYGVQPEDLSYFWYPAHACICARACVFSDILLMCTRDLWEVKGMSAKLMTYQGKMGKHGDNYKEGCLDAEYLTGTGNGIRTVIANSNTSSSAEEGLGYGRALLSFVADLSNGEKIPNVLSLSIGSLSFASCDKMCKLIEASHPYDKCWKYLTTTQRQVCVFASQGSFCGS